MDNEAALVAAIREKDQSALVELIELKRPQLTAFVERLLGTKLRRKIEAEDIIQEVSVAAVQGLDGMDLAERDPFSWLCQLAERRIIDAHRHFFGAQKRDAGREIGLGSPGGGTQQAGLINMLVVSMTTPSQAFSRDQREFRLHSAINQLPEEHQKALRMRYVENLPTKQIAEKLGKADGAVRVMLTRCLKKLEELLTEEDQ
ncbi:MAG: sigma-70 family RNA polymerase sigma factor [Pirellulales bacterium]